MNYQVEQKTSLLAVIDIGEELSHGRRESANELRDLCKSLEDEGTLTFVLDFKKVKLCPSIVFGNLLVLGKHISEKGGRIYLANPSEHVEKAAKITGLTTTITLVHSVDEALEAEGS
jgi:anti-anti-sigma factor